MPKFKKRPIVIEAELVSGLCRNAKDFWQRLPKWVADAYERGEILFIGNKMSVMTLEGRMNADPTDWLICGVKGEIYPCKADVFAASYDEVHE